MTTAGGRRHSRGRDIAWAVLMLFMALNGLAATVGVVACLVSTSWFGALRAAATLLFCYWVAVGAWRRTSWAAR